jgi:hypothetical protein
MRIYLSAGPSVRAVCLPEVIAGEEYDVEDGAEAATVLGLLTPAQLAAGQEEGEWLEARWTGETYKGLPWWEIRRPEEWT